MTTTSSETDTHPDQKKMSSPAPIAEAKSSRWLNDDPLEEVAESVDIQPGLSNEDLLSSIQEMFREMKEV